MSAMPAVTVPLPDVSTFGKRLAYIRWYYGLSRSQFLSQTGVAATEGSLRNWEEGKPCTQRDEIAFAIEAHFSEFPAEWTLRGRGSFGPGPTSPTDPSRRGKDEPTVPYVRRRSVTGRSRRAFLTQPPALVAA